MTLNDRFDELFCERKLRFGLREVAVEYTSASRVLRSFCDD
jgi:hypothetical protein